MNLHVYENISHIINAAGGLTWGWLIKGEINLQQKILRLRLFDPYKSILVES